MIYQVLYAEDVPHYGLVEIEASSPEEALAVARSRDYDDAYLEPEWSNGVCRRIVEICDPAGEILEEDISLDSCFLRYGGEPDRLRCQAAEAMLAALKTAETQLQQWAESYPDDAETAHALARVTAAIEAAEGVPACDQPSLF